MQDGTFSSSLMAELAIPLNLAFSEPALPRTEAVAGYLGSLSYPGTPCLETIGGSACGLLVS